MSVLDQAVQTQINHIQEKTGKSFAELAVLVKNSGLSKHSELREMLMRELGLGYGDANSLMHAVLESDGVRAAAASGLSGDAVLDELYSGPKAGLRPIHDALMVQIRPFGEFEILPKKGYVSLRRKKQFAMIGPATHTRVEVGINIKQVDAALLAWLKAAFESAG